LKATSNVPAGNKMYFAVGVVGEGGRGGMSMRDVQVCGTTTAVMLVSFSKTFCSEKRRRKKKKKKEEEKFRSLPAFSGVRFVFDRFFDSFFLHLSTSF
jgi:hypothetical protein